MPRKSPPKQKCGPAPVRTTARTALLRAQVMAAASRSIAICRLRALPFCGRLSVTSATAPRASTSTVTVAIGASLVGRDTQAQPRELRGELQLAGKARVLLVVRELGEQFALIRHRRGQARLPLRVYVDVTGGARAHAAADGRDAVVELAQILHHLDSGLRLDLVLDSVAIHDPHQRHAPLRDPNLLVCRFAVRAPTPQRAII